MYWIDLNILFVILQCDESTLAAIDVNLIDGLDYVAYDTKAFKS